MPITTPARISVSSGSRPRSDAPTAVDQGDGRKAAANASAWMPTMPHDMKMATAAPSAAPDDTPRMSGETSGLRNMPW